MILVHVSTFLNLLSIDLVLRLARRLVSDVLYVSSEILQHQLGHQSMEGRSDPDILREGSAASLVWRHHPGEVVRLTRLVELAAVGGDAVAVEKIVDELGLRLTV